MAKLEEDVNGSLVKEISLSWRMSFASCLAWIFTWNMCLSHVLLGLYHGSFVSCVAVLLWICCSLSCLAFFFGIRILLPVFAWFFPGNNSPRREKKAAPLRSTLGTH